MGIIKQTILECDNCGVEAKCGSLPPIEAITAMKKRGWFYHHRVGCYCNGCTSQINKDKKEK